MSYDRVDWHSERDFPEDLPEENAGTHIGMFLAWAIINELESEEHQEDCPESLTAIRARLMTGSQFLFSECDGKFSDIDLNEKGNAFAQCYYAAPDFPYLIDYTQAFQDAATVYHVADTWENYDRIAPVITERFNQWKESR
jgi:hypothetical protein